MFAAFERWRRPLSGDWKARSDGHRSTKAEKEHAAHAASKRRWLSKATFVATFGKASELEVRRAGGVVAEGPYLGHVADITRRRDDPSRWVQGRWRPVPDRAARGLSVRVPPPRVGPFHRRY